MFRVPLRVLRTWTAGVAVGVAGCGTTSPDVVAVSVETSVDASAPLDVTLVKGCRAGRYDGSVRSVDPGDGGVYVPVTAYISFVLEKEESGEFLRLRDDSALQGQTETGQTFSATVRGGSRCAGGAFQTSLEDGSYYLSPGSAPLPFSGPIDGYYVSDRLSSASTTEVAGFIGSWKIDVMTPTFPHQKLTQVGGAWSANWVGAE